MSNIKFHYCLLLTLTVLTSCAQTSSRLPDLIKVGDPGFISSELIYALDNKPTAECHASTLVELSDGIMAAWFGGTEERHPDVGIWTSVHKQGQWSHPVQVANGFENDSVRYPCWNPVLFKPAKGPLMLFYKVGPSPSDWWGMLITSEDEGKTWSYPKRLGKHNVIKDLLGPVKNNILTYGNGKMQILCRTQEGVIAQSWSKDNGKNWSPLQATSLSNPNAGTDAVTLKDGRQLLVYNHTLSKGEFPNERNMLNVTISSDGTEWKPILTLERSEGEYSYPAVIQSSDGLVHITYTYWRKAIKHVVIDPAKLK